MTPADLAILDAVAAQCERMSIYDTQRIGVEDVHALARAIRAALAHARAASVVADGIDDRLMRGSDRNPAELRLWRSLLRQPEADPCRCGHAYDIHDDGGRCARPCGCDGYQAVRA